MRNYEPKTPRAALGLAGIAMSAIVLGALVILPAEMDAYAAPDVSNLAYTPAQAARDAGDAVRARKSESDALRCTNVNAERSPAG